MKMFFEFARKKLFVSVLVCYLSLFLVGSVRKIITFYLGGGDFVNYIYQILTALNISSIFPIQLFIAGSITLSFLHPLFIMLMLAFYGMVIQILLIIFKKTPSRFSINLGLMFYALAHAYLFLLIPYIGGLLYAIFFIYFTSKELAAENELSVLKGVLLLCSPFLMLVLVLIGVAIAISGLISSLL